MNEDDILFEMLQNGELDALGEALLEENHRLANDPEFMTTKRTQEDILADAYHEIALREKQRIRSNRVKRLAVLRRVAIIAIAVLAAFVVTAMSVEAIRIPILNFFTEPLERATRMSPHSDDEPEPSKYDPKDVSSYKLHLVPDGFALDSDDTGSDYYQQNYINADGVTLRFTARNYFDYWFDTEDADLIEPLQINGMEGYYVEKGGRLLVAWVDEKNLIVFRLLGDLPKKTLIQIAEKSGLKN